MYSIKNVLMKRDGMTETEAIDLIKDAKRELDMLIADGDILTADDICEHWFGLEPDYLDDLMYNY